MLVLSIGEGFIVIEVLDFVDLDEKACIIKGIVRHSLGGGKEVYEVIYHFFKY